LAAELVHCGYHKALVISELGLAKSTYYYKPTSGKPGRPQTSSILVDGVPKPNQEVLGQLAQEFVGQEYLDYGYRRLALVAREKAITVNHKKLYRLMREAKMLKKRVARPVTTRTLSPERKPRPKAPFECLELDFKYIYCPSASQNVYLLTMLDVFTRRIIAHSLDKRMRRDRVIEMVKQVKADHPEVTSMGLRTDNGCQFTAKEVADYLKVSNIKHEFTKPATPQENGHIEAWHATLEREYLGRNAPQTYSELTKGLQDYILVYNSKRAHSALKYQTPEAFYKAWITQQTLLKAEEPKEAPPAESHIK
jgi:putative transposase